MPSIDDSRCILVTGATAGIGRALAQSIAKLPSSPRVVAVGRRQERLDELAKSGIDTLQMDLDAPRDALKHFVADVLRRYPDLDAVVFCAGMQYEVHFTEGMNLDRIASELNVNYTSIVTMTAHFLPHLQKLAATGRPCHIYIVTSALAVLAAARVANYSASKAALRCFTMSLRAQLNGTGIHVVEIIPPLVESELHDAEGTTERLSKFWMPLDAFTKSTMEGLRRGDAEVAVEAVVSVISRYEAGKMQSVEENHQRHLRMLEQTSN